jgi:hypothetical protein
MHTQMQFPPYHSSYLVPANVIYNIPMATAYGAGVPIPPAVGATLDIDVDAIRDVIVVSGV